MSFLCLLNGVMIAMSRGDKPCLQSGGKQVVLLRCFKCTCIGAVLCATSTKVADSLRQIMYEDPSHCER